jgi:two-component system cell cycle sensor histidine kinase/response regulator CckA
MKDPKTQFIDEQVSKLTQLWLGRVFLIGMALFPLLGIMDYVVAPAFFHKFIVYRIFITFFLFILYLLNKLKLHTVAQYTLLLIGTAMSGVSIELMILQLGGHSSSYYAGLNLVLIAALGFIPMGMVVSCLCVAVIYSIYLVPILVFDTITNFPLFLSHNAFMLATFTIALSWRALGQKVLIKQLDLQYDLVQDRMTLANNSEQLKQLVQERTALYLESESSYRAIFDNSMDGILVLDGNGIIVKSNEKAHKIHDVATNSLQGSNIHLLQLEKNREKFLGVIKRVLDGENVLYETEHYRKDGSPVSLEVCANRVSLGDANYVQMILRDITEKKKIQEHLLQSQKMESVATLAGGISHDLNNVLTAILGHTEILGRRIKGSLENDDTIITSLNVIERAVRNGSRMISQLMDFARRKKSEIFPISVNDIIVDTLKLVERVLSKNISIKLELDPTIPRVDGDVTQLSQVIMNLVVNAKDAMPGGGDITINTSKCSRYNIYNSAPPFVPAADYVVLKMSDTGAGIPQEVKANIFEPFFTTKEHGKGTGLGLAMVYSVVTNHRGYVAVTSEPARGTTFTLFFPVSSADSLRQYTFIERRVQKNKTVLVVDDDEMNLNIIKDTLEREQYKVLATTNPRLALEMFNSGRDRIALVITDILMPNIDGHELAHQILKIKPEQRILTITGNSELRDYPVMSHEYPILKKPFDSATLINNVKRVLLA